MRVLFKCPSFAKHGGIRVIVEHCNGLANLGHDVILQVYNTGTEPDWMHVHPDVDIVYGNPSYPKNYFDSIIACSPIIANECNNDRYTGRKYLFLQMCEELFKPNDAKYVQQIVDAYRLPMPIIGISEWNKNRVIDVHGRDKSLPYHIIGNGVSDEFKPGKKDDELTVLVEGWIGYNFAKDQKAIGPAVAKRIKEKYGAKILAYSQFPAHTLRFGDLPFLNYQKVPNEYYFNADTETIVSLNQRAHLLIKASVYDARSCAPVEAMKCGTTTARAITEGDDDLFDGINCLRCEYDEEQLFQSACTIIEDVETRNALESNGLLYAEKNLSWDHWSKEFEKIISNEAS